MGGSAWERVGARKQGFRRVLVNKVSPEDIRIHSITVTPVALPGPETTQLYRLPPPRGPLGPQQRHLPLSGFWVGNGLLWAWSELPPAPTRPDMT